MILLVSVFGFKIWVLDSRECINNKKKKYSMFAFDSSIPQCVILLKIQPTALPNVVHLVSDLGLADILTLKHCPGSLSKGH